MADDFLAISTRDSPRPPRRRRCPESPGNRPSPRRWIHRRRTSRRVAGHFVDAAVADGVCGRPVSVGRAAVRAGSAGLSSDHSCVALRVERRPVCCLRDPHRERPKPKGHGVADVGAGLLAANPLHPTSQIAAGVAQCIFQATIAAPMFWGWKAVDSAAQLRRLLIVAFVFNTRAPRSASFRCISQAVHAAGVQFTWESAE